MLLIIALSVAGCKERDNRELEQAMRFAIFGVDVGSIYRNDTLPVARGSVDTEAVRISRERPTEYTKTPGGGYHSSPVGPYRDFKLVYSVRMTDPCIFIYSLYSYVRLQLDSTELHIPAGSYEAKIDLQNMYLFKIGKSEYSDAKDDELALIMKGQNIYCGLSGLADKVCTPRWEHSFSNGPLRGAAPRDEIERRVRAVEVVKRYCPGKPF
jgi:hypothetical protein